MYPYPMPPFAPPPRRSNAGLWWFLGIVGAITAVLTVILAVSAANSPEWEDCVADAHSVAPGLSASDVEAFCTYSEENGFL